MSEKSKSIALLVPSRKRPEMLERMYASALSTAKRPDRLYLFAYIDDDDGSYESLEMPNMCKVIGPRVVLSQTWNRLWQEAGEVADFYGHMDDDLIFRTAGWDEQIIYSFPLDKIAFVHGTDGSEQDVTGFGTHGFLHKNWTDSLGRLVPPYFSCDYNDTWLNDVADLIERHVLVEDVLIEHMHPVWGKREPDQTDIERVERGKRDNVDELYRSKWQERNNDAKKLKEAIAAYRQRV